VATVKKSSLQSLLQGTSLPDLPPFDPDWTLKQYEDAQVIWKRKLAEYLRRLSQQLTGPNIFNEIIQQIPPDQIIQIIGGGSGVGFGPLVVEVYADYAWVDGSTAFGGTLVGTAKDSSLHNTGIENRWGIGDDFGIGSDRLTVHAIRITGKIVAEVSKSYNIEVQHDDGARFYFDNVLELDHWGSAGTQNFNTATLVAGTAYPFKLELVNSSGDGFSYYIAWHDEDESVLRDIPFSALRAP
jgi:hypothetical protein